MKAALNGVLNLSTLGGWRIEACIDGVNKSPPPPFSVCITMNRRAGGG